MKLHVAAMLLIAAGCGGEESYQPPRWVDGAITLRPVLMQCAWEGSALEVALVAVVDRADFGGVDVEFLVGLVIAEEGTDGETRIFGGWMDTRALTSSASAHPLDARLASELAPGTDPTFERVTYATGQSGTFSTTEPFAFRGEAEIRADDTSCHGRVDVTKVIFGRDADRVVFPFEGEIDP